MPCNSDYLEPSERARELQRVAKLTVYVLTSIGKPVSSQCLAASRNPYCVADYTDPLCALIRHMLSPEQIDRVMYDGRNPQARDLADWWDRHKAADEARLLEQEKKARQRSLVDDTLRTLTPEQVEALRAYIQGELT